jgi:hypothetical protein
MHLPSGLLHDSCNGHLFLSLSRLYSPTFLQLQLDTLRFRKRTILLEDGTSRRSSCPYPVGLTLFSGLYSIVSYCKVVSFSSGPSDNFDERRVNSLRAHRG